MGDDAGRAARAPAVRRKEVFRTVRGAQLSASRGRPAAPPADDGPDAAAEPQAVYVRHRYREPND